MDRRRNARAGVLVVLAARRDSGKAAPLPFRRPGAGGAIADPREVRAMSEPAGAVLEAADLRNQFRGVHAVCGVSFTVPAGQRGGMIGPYGAGNLTVLNIIAGVLKPVAGTVSYLG